MKLLKVGWDACIGVGYRTCDTFWLPLQQRLDNFVSSQGSCSGQFFIGEKIMQFCALRACLVAAAVENDIFCISQGIVATFFGRVDRFKNPYVEFLQNSVYQKLFILVYF